MGVVARLEPEALDPAAELSAFQAARAGAGGAAEAPTGAIVSFTGLVRAEGGEVSHLRLDAYPALTERSLIEIGEAVTASAAVTGVLIVHRSGIIPAGAPVVFACTA